MEISENPVLQKERCLCISYSWIPIFFFLCKTPDWESGKRRKFSCRACAFLSAPLGTFGVRENPSLLHTALPAELPGREGLFSFPFLQPTGTVCHFSVNKGWCEDPSELDVFSEGQTVGGGDESYMNPTP